jgi:hypothetical protein
METHCSELCENFRENSSEGCSESDRQNDMEDCGLSSLADVTQRSEESGQQRTSPRAPIRRHGADRRLGWQETSQVAPQVASQERPQVVLQVTPQVTPRVAIQFTLAMPPGVASRVRQRVASRYAVQFDP